MEWPLLYRIDLNMYGTEPKVRYYFDDDDDLDELDGFICACYRRHRIEGPSKWTFDEVYTLTVL